MPSGILLDNDIILKSATYRLGNELLKATTIAGVGPTMLGVGHFVIPKKLARARNIAERTGALSALAALLSRLNTVEPNPTEIEWAASLEAKAIRLNLELDTGECQLIAILLHRSYDYIVTGDKRAIFAIAKFPLDSMTARIACFEQLMADIISLAGAESIRPRICAEPRIDTAISNCFSCSAPTCPQPASVIEGLHSYITDLRRNAPGVLTAKIN